MAIPDGIYGTVAKLSGANRLSESRLKLAMIDSLELPSREAHRLRAMGAYEGQHVGIERTKHVVMLTVLGARIAIAKDAAARIFVAALPDTEAT